VLCAQPHCARCAHDTACPTQWRAGCRREQLHRNARLLVQCPERGCLGRCCLVGALYLPLGKCIVPPSRELSRAIANRQTRAAVSSPPKLRMPFLIDLALSLSLPRARALSQSAALHPSHSNPKNRQATVPGRRQTSPLGVPQVWMHCRCRTLPSHKTCIHVYMCVYIYMSIYVYICTHTHTHTHTHIHTHTHTYIYIYIYIYTYIHTYIHTYVYTYIHTHTHTYIHTYIYTYIYMSQNLMIRTHTAYSKFIIVLPFST
jgi:hypothetical protein